jgi:hypothetical protein
MRGHIWRRACQWLLHRATPIHTPINHALDEQQSRHSRTMAE